MFERSQLCGLDYDTVTYDTYLVAAFDLTLTHNTSGDRTHFGDVERLQHLEGRCHLFLHLRSQHTFHSSLDLVDRVVDDGVDTDIHLLGLGHLTGSTGRTNVKADDDRIRSRSQHHIAVTDSTHSTVDDVHLDIFRREFQERVLDSLYRTVHIGLDDDIQLLEIADRQTTTDLLETHVFLRADRLFALQLLTFVRYLARLLLRRQHIELVTCLRRTVQTED